MTTKTYKKIIDTFESLSDYKFFPIVEKDINNNPVPEKDRSVLGIIEGIFFVPNGKSRNGRWYSKEFWEAVLSKPDVQIRLKELMMYGAIGHKETPVSDDDLNEGKVSHIVVKLWINEQGQGMGRLLILNTEAGRNLKTYMSVEYEGRRSKLRISSRAAGEYKDGISYEGLPVVDEDNYYLDTFDVVKEPGFIETDLNLVTDKKPENKILENSGSEKIMTLTESEIQAVKKLLEGSQKNEGNTLLVENTNLKNEVKTLQEKLTNESEKTKIINSLPKDVLFVLESLVESKNISFVKEWSEIGSPVEIKEANEKMEKQIDILEKYTAIDTPENIEALMKKISESSAELAQYRELGKVDEVKESLTKVKELTPKLEKLGNIDEAIKALEQVKVVIPQLKTKLESEEKKQFDFKATEISKKYSQPLESVKNHLKKLGESETHKYYSQLAENKPKHQDKSDKPSGFNEGIKTIIKNPTDNVRNLLETINSKGG